MGGQRPEAPELKGAPRERQKKEKENEEWKITKKEKKRENETFQILGASHPIHPHESK